jgi:hypothetical protein
LNVVLLAAYLLVVIREKAALNSTAIVIILIARHLVIVVTGSHNLGDDAPQLIVLAAEAMIYGFAILKVDNVGRFATFATIMAHHFEVAIGGIFAHLKVEFSLFFIDIRSYLLG